MRMPNRPDPREPMGDDEWNELYQPRHAFPASPEVWDDLDRKPSIPFGFQVPRRNRPSGDRALSTQARARRARRRTR
jgi:hypothetical protein